MIVTPHAVDISCRKLSVNEFEKLNRYKEFAKLTTIDSGVLGWPKSPIQKGQRQIIKLDFSFDGPCTTRPCERYGENAKTFDFLRRLIDNNPNRKIGIGVFSGNGGNYSYSKTITQRKAEGIMRELNILGIEHKNIITFGFGNQNMNPDYVLITGNLRNRGWAEIVILN